MIAKSLHKKVVWTYKKASDVVSKISQTKDVTTDLKKKNAYNGVDKTRTGAVTVSVYVSLAAAP